MTQHVAHLLDAALTLSASERRELLARLVSSLEDDEAPPFKSASPAEVKRRLAAAEEGTARGVPLERVMAATRRALRRSSR